jgi:hypothetical protein
MKIIDLDTTLIEGYVKLLNNLSTDNKLDLISQLTLSVKKDMNNKQKSFYRAFGAWNSKQTAEEIIFNIRSNRSFNRQLEQF